MPFGTLGLHPDHSVVEWGGRPPGCAAPLRGHIRVAGLETVDKMSEPAVGPRDTAGQIRNEDRGEADHHKRSCIELRVHDELHKKHCQTAEHDGANRDSKYELTCPRHSKAHVWPRVDRARDG